MMINCPNCNLLQPKDQYCAQCGINMETWKAPQPPIWKKIIGNWMFQLSLLFLAVLAVVLMDSFTEKPQTSDLQATLPVRESIPRSNIDLDEPTLEESSTEVQTPPSPRVASNTAQAPSPQTNTEADASAALPFKQIASLRVATMGRASIEQIYEVGQKIDENTYIVPQKIFTQVLAETRETRKSMGTTQENFEFNKPTQLFVGEEDLETGLQLGTFVQLNVANYDQQSPLRYQLVFWHQLQLSGEPGERKRVDISIPPESYLVIVDTAAHDLSFTPEERTLFESSDRLNSLNSPRFQEEQSDIVLVLEIK